MGALLIFILILSVLILIHELGHFLTAKKAGVKVEEFGMGIPPRIVGKKIGETIYSINLFPFGGFVRLKGEDTFEYSEEELDDPNSFMAKTVWQRGAILAAGVFMNLLFGVALFYFLLGLNGFKSLYIPLIFDHEFKFGNVQHLDTVIFSFDESSPLPDKNVKLGQAIVQINGEPINSVQDVRTSLEALAGEGVILTLKDVRGRLPLQQITVVPYEDEEGKTVLGVYLGSAPRISYDTPVQKIFSGFLHAYNILDYSVKGFAKLISISFQEKTAAPLSQSVSGPIGIYSIVDNILDYSGGGVLLNLIDLTALISVSLALINILPLPALDGGRILFVVIEAVRGKKVNPEMETTVHKIGILLLISLLVLVSVRDIFRIFL